MDVRSMNRQSALSESGAKIYLGLFLILLGPVGCGPNSQLNRARKLEEKGKYYKSWERYQEVAAKYPTSELAPEALFRAGLVAQRFFKDCYLANTMYSRVVQGYPQADPWARASSLQIRNCPDYFPLIPGMKWVEVDSETKGRTARIETICRTIGTMKHPLPSEGGILVRKFFAGGKPGPSTRTVYLKKEDEIREYPSETDPRYRVALQWPLEEGKTWSTRFAGRLFRYKIVSVDRTIKVKAGKFEHCIHLRYFVDGYPGVFTNEYYAPGVGRVMTSQTVRNVEKRTTELSSFKRGKQPDFKENKENEESS